jgi:hypothetical protein
MHLNIMGEYYNGKILDTPPSSLSVSGTATPAVMDNNGGYIQLDYTPGVNKLTPYVRWEQWNDPAESHRTNNWTQDTIGCAYNTTAKNRYTFEYNHIDDANGYNYNNFGLQWQFAYGG